MFISPGAALGEDGFISTWHTTAVSFRWRQKQAEIFHHVSKKQASLWNLLLMKVMDCRINLSHRETDNVAPRSRLNGSDQTGGYRQHDEAEVFAVVWDDWGRNLPVNFFFPTQCKTAWINVFRVFFIIPELALLPEPCLGPGGRRAVWGARLTISNERSWATATRGMLPMPGPRLWHLRVSWWPLQGFLKAVSLPSWLTGMLIES